MVWEKLLAENIRQLTQYFIEATKNPMFIPTITVIIFLFIIVKWYFKNRGRWSRYAI